MTIPAIAFFVFNRPESTARVLAAIRAARPDRLYVVADGPRPARPEDAAKCTAVREMIARGVDWPCVVRTEYATQNLGCGRRIASGIDWVFQHEEEAVFLEDDCVPDPTFFPYCAELLERFRDNPRVGMISGSNVRGTLPRDGASYFYSAYNFIWGWATWRHSWALFDRSMARWPELRRTRWLRHWLRSRPAAAYWQDRFDEMHAGRIDTWDYPWTFSLWANSQLAVLPAVNLVTNIGFGPDATHSSDADRALSKPALPMEFPLRHAGPPDRDWTSDRYFERHMFRIGWKYLIKHWLKRRAGIRVSTAL